MKKILVCGASGFIGLNLVKFFKNKNLSFIFPSQKSKLTYFVTKRVLVDTDKTLKISYFGSIEMLSDSINVDLTYPI